MTRSAIQDAEQVLRSSAPSWPRLCAAAVVLASRDHAVTATTLQELVSGVSYRDAQEVARLWADETTGRGRIRSTVFRESPRGEAMLHPWDYK